MITYSVCMQCQRPLDKVADAGPEPFRFVLSHGICPGCREKLLAEVRAFKLDIIDSTDPITKIKYEHH